MGVQSISVQNALNALPEDEDEMVWDKTGRVAMPRKDHDSYVARGIDPWSQIKVTPYRKDPAAPLGAPLEDGGSGSDLSPEPERPTFGPIPGMAPEQVDSVIKFASERAQSDAPEAGGPSEEEKMKMAMAFARKKAGRNEGKAMMMGAGQDFADAIADRAPDGDFEKTLMGQARQPVSDLKEDQGNQRTAAKTEAEQARMAREYALKKLGLLDDQARDGANEKFRRDQLAETGRHNLASEKTDAIDAVGRAGKRRNTGGWTGGPKTIAPGYTADGTVKLSPKEASDFRGSVATKQDFLRGVAQLKELHAKKGTELGGDTAAKMASISTKLKLQLKDMAKLGALSGSDTKMLEDLVPDPSSWGANIRSTLSLGMSDPTSAQLDELVGQAESLFGSQMRSLGVSEDARPAPGGRGQQAGAGDDVDDVLSAFGKR